MATFDAAVKAYQAGDFDAALSAARFVIAKKAPNHAMAQALIGNILLKRGDKPAAATAFVQAAQANRAEAPAFLKLAATLFLQAGQADEARRIGLEAGLLNRADPAFVLVMAQTLLAPWDNAARQAVTQLIPFLDRASGPAMFFAASFYRANWQLPELKALLDEARDTVPGDVAIEGLRFASAHDLVDLATIARHQALMAAPDEPYARAVLQVEQALSRVLWCEDQSVQAKPVREHLALAKSFAARPPRRKIGMAEQPLHIGYLSSDFHAHATMTLFLDSLLAHDRSRFRITLFCYTAKTYSADQQAMPQLLRQELVSLRDLSDEAAAAEIDRQQVDILVDLKGHTPGARLGIVNLSSAPLKATYLGFPGPVSSVDLDYAITDPVVTPDSAEAFYREKFCRLPDCYQANSAASRPQPRPSRRADHGLPEHAFVFASFNGVHKITPQTMSLWARVLRFAPDSLLWMLCPDAIARTNLEAGFVAEGIDPARILFAAKQDYGEHVHRLPLADLALDTFPCNGHTTTSDMLWGGLPVLTKRGHCFAGRVSESLLKAVGLDQLVADDEEVFVSLAAHLARQPDKIAALKSHLAASRHTAPLFNTLRFTRHLERAYEMMAERARAGLAPTRIDVPALPG
ncbi:glycosyl transferase [Agrobacterium vitis]|uniref:O-linked N-acetylglucosamine transferase, SPINDLY family protein n=1 Tax=Agrobacterium vitis TaxID=373 RepID=UPI0018D22153|nr:glycosyl transferase [Agrobacterium vitis]